MAKRLKILIVDDSNEILKYLTRFFESYGFVVYTSTDGLDGIQRAVELRPDIIFLDLMMPTFDGIKMLQVKSVLKEIINIPVIVVSANTARRNVVAALEAGANKVLSKPLKEQKIIEYINEVLGDNYFESKTRRDFFTKNEISELKDEMVMVFLDSFLQKKRTITEAIRNKNEEMLKTAIHEIKGAGGTMGYPELTELSEEIEKKDFNSPTDWVFAEFKCNRIFQKVQQIQNKFQKQI